MFWGQLVRAQPSDLGTSAWKQSYQIRPDLEQPPENVYPGHLVVARPGALRTSLTLRILESAYRYRSRHIQERHFRMIARGLGGLAAEDFRHLLRLKFPVLTMSIPYRALRDYYKLRRQQLTLPDFEYAVAKAFVRSEFQHCAHGRPVVFVITQILSFAKDIDTKGELAEAGTSKPCVFD
jgi:hypothetical protein